ncbi:MFS transporter [Gordonia sinesedis]
MAVFALNGFLAAMWVANIPAITEHTGTGHEQLGILLLVLGGAAFLGMQVSGRLIDRSGSRPASIGAAALLCAVIVGPAVADSTLTLGFALAGFGFINGGIDVAMNSQAVEVERAYGRPIMSAFHGFFSIGGLVGSGVVAATLWADIGVPATVVGAAIFGMVVLAVAATGLVGPDYGTPQAAAPHSRRAGAARTGREKWWHGVDLRRLTILAVVAFVAMLAEGTAYDWSALQVVQSFGTDDAVGAIAFGCFSAAMTVARFTIDPIAAAVGPVAVVRWGALIGILGMTVAITAPSAILAIAGWTVFGIGLAGLVPQIFTAAGNLTERSSGRVISMVVGCGYLGMLAGPAMVGFLSARTSLDVGLTPVLAGLVLALLTARVMRPASAHTTVGTVGPVPH